MRVIKDHETNTLNEALRIDADERDIKNGNASHFYSISNPDGKAMALIQFQKGPLAEHGLNGISNEALLAVVIDRLRGFQDGQWRCRENAIALTKIEEALHWLHSRTRSRVARGVEGTSAV